MDEKSLLLQISEMMEQQTKEIKLTIENQVTKRIETLFDSYKLTHEKQYELERETQALKNKIDMLETRLSNLENKIA